MFQIIKQLLILDLDNNCKYKMQFFKIMILFIKAKKAIQTTCLRSHQSVCDLSPDFN